LQWRNDRFLFADDIDMDEDEEPITIVPKIVDQETKTIPEVTVTDSDKKPKVDPEVNQMESVL
jgi:hypothetical protein